MLVSGALSASLVTGLVLAPLKSNQNRLFAHVRHWEEDQKRRWEQLVRKGREVENDPQNSPTPALSAMNRDPLLSLNEHLSLSLKLLAPPPGAGFEEISHHPLVFGIAGGPDMLSRLMEPSHLGRPLVHVAFNDAADCGAYAKAANQLP